MANEIAEMKVKIEAEWRFWTGNSPHPDFVKHILSLETDTCRIAVVLKNAELPKNPYPIVNGVRHDLAHDDWDISTVIDGSCYRGYDIAQRDMLNAGFVQEVKDEGDTR